MEMIEFANLISKAFPYFTPSEVFAILLGFKILCIALFLFFSAFIIFALIKTSWLRYGFLEGIAEFLTYRPYGVKRIAKIWSKITERLETFSEQEYKLAVMEADDILDKILEKMGYPGKNLKDRLKLLTKATLPNIDQILEAHRIRDDILHDPDYRLTRDQAKKLLAIYERALSDLESL